MIEAGTKNLNKKFGPRRMYDRKLGSSKDFFSFQCDFRPEPKSTRDSSFVQSPDQNLGDPIQYYKSPGENEGRKDAQIR
jgi:hypothetical protein